MAHSRGLAGFRSAVRLLPGIQRLPSTPPVILDRFTAADSTLLTAHNPDIYPVGSVWTVAYYGDLSISITGNQAVSDNERANYIEAGLSDCVITADLLCPLNDNYISDILFRYQDRDNFWRAGFQNGRLGIYQRVSGTVLRADCGPFDRDEVYSVTVRMSGTSLSASANGLTAEYTSSFCQSMTAHGLYLSGDGSNLMQADNFKVESL